MADHTIYLRADSELTRKPTQPKTITEKVATSNFTPSTVNKSFQKTANIIGNPDSLVSAGVGFIAKAIPAVAAAAVLFHVTDKVVSSVMEFTTAETGDYGAQVSYNNMKTALGMTLRPFSTAIQYAKTQQQARLYQYKIDENRKLIGNSIINSGFNDVRSV